MTDTILIVFLFFHATGLSTGFGSLAAFFIKDYHNRVTVEVTFPAVSHFPI